jgi:hypothetical protein
MVLLAPEDKINAATAIRTLGHLETTMVYVHMASTALKEAHAKSSPLIGFSHSEKRALAQNTALILRRSVRTIANNLTKRERKKRAWGEVGEPRRPRRRIGSGSSSQLKAAPDALEFKMTISVSPPPPWPAAIAAPGAWGIPGIGCGWSGGVGAHWLLCPDRFTTLSSHTSIFSLR